MDKLLPQAELCLNHLIPYGANPNISAFEGLHGCQFDFRAHPIAPAGTKVHIHDKPTGRSSWAPHGVLGFILDLPSITTVASTCGLSTHKQTE